MYIQTIQCCHNYNISQLIACKRQFVGSAFDRPLIQGRRFLQSKVQMDRVHSLIHFPTTNSHKATFDLNASTHGPIKTTPIWPEIGPLVALDKNNCVLIERETLCSGHQGVHFAPNRKGPTLVQS